MIRGRALFVGMNFVTSPFFDAEMEENRRSSLRERGAFPSSEARFKGVNLVPKEKVPAKPGNEM